MLISQIDPVGAWAQSSLLAQAPMPPAPLPAAPPIPLPDAPPVPLADDELLDTPGIPPAPSELELTAPPCEPEKV
ncbi:MAG TPA: hypothetical protein PK156_46595, partial [Polyangium sp.]|nr:hypothetical protein [Polyangium sp.]